MISYPLVDLVDSLDQSLSRLHIPQCELLAFKGLVILLVLTVCLCCHDWRLSY